MRCEIRPKAQFDRLTLGSLLMIAASCLAVTGHICWNEGERRGHSEGFDHGYAYCHDKPFPRPSMTVTEPAHPTSRDPFADLRVDYPTMSLSADRSAVTLLVEHLVIRNAHGDQITIDPSKAGGRRP